MFFLEKNTMHISFKILSKLINNYIIYVIYIIICIDIFDDLDYNLFTMFIMVKP